jgi:mono/diheme cytochrome c family protein
VRATALFLALAFAGCGSGSSGGGAKTPKQVFAGTCGTCHTLEAAGTNGTFGPNLDQLAPDKARVLSAIEHGPGAMPAGRLKGAQAGAVAGYVSSVAGSGG